MADLLRFHRLVPVDLRTAIQWYNDISTDLGNRFRAALDSRFDAIAEHPRSFPFAFDDVRFARVKRFPYIILFRPCRELIQILGVFHSSSDPKKWAQRGTET